MAFELKNLNYEIFALFVLSVLWRASESTVSFYRGVQLGPYADHLREVLWRRQAPPPADHAIQLGTSLDNPYKNTILQPDFCRHDGLRFYRLFFPNVFAIVKMDQQRVDPLMLLGMVQPRETNYVLCYPYAQSPYSRFFEGMKKRMAELRRLGRIMD
jgi:hypothetical protein